MDVKKKSILLKYWAVTGVFEVKQVTNAVDVRPGQTMDLATAQKYCDAPDWEVTVESVDINIPLPVLPIP